MKAERILELADDFRKNGCQGSEPLVVLWLVPTAGAARDKLARDLQEARGERPIVPIVLREPLFLNPNSVAVDLVKLLEANRKDFEAAAEQWGAGERLVVLVLSRTPLSVPQISSPARLPEWLRHAAGSEVDVDILDFEAAATVPFNSPELDVGEIQERLYELEKSLVRRLVRRHRQEPVAVQEFFRLTLDREEANAPVEDFLAVAEARLGQSVNGRTYRPSAREGASVVGRIMRLGAKSSPDKLASAAEKFSEALGLGPGSADAACPPLSAAMVRVPKIREPKIRCGWTLLVTVYQASQLSIAAAHSDTYPSYAIRLVSGVGADMRRALWECLRVLEDPGEVA